VTLDRFIYCGNYCEKYFAGICWSKWKQVCDYEEFSNKEKMKALSDAEMVLKAREKP
jgi:ribosomal protein S13